jgi:enoyl-CoA hydratase/carnithine racemase
VATITIDRPGALNAIGLRTIGALSEAVDAVGAMDVSVVVLTGGGERAFVSGGDLKELAAIRTAADAQEMATSMRRVLDRIASLPVPVLAALNGHTLGGGAEVAVACDMRIAADDVRIGFNQASLAIMPAWGGAERLVELVGRGRALALLAGATVLSSGEAQALGLVDEVVPRAEFAARWRERAAELAVPSPAAARRIKSVVAAVRPGVHREHEAAAVEAFADLWVADDHWDAVAERSRARRLRP